MHFRQIIPPVCERSLYSSTRSTLSQIGQRGGYIRQINCSAHFCILSLATFHRAFFMDLPFAFSLCALLVHLCLVYFAVAPLCFSAVFALWLTYPANSSCLCQISSALTHPLCQSAKACLLGNILLHLPKSLLIANKCHTFSGSGHCCI